MALPAQKPTAGLNEGGAPAPMNYGKPTQAEMNACLKGMGNKTYRPGTSKPARR